jgi:hypothetical protein
MARMGSEAVGRRERQLRVGCGKPERGHAEVRFLR